MSPVEVERLSRQLRRARRMLAAESPGGPAWAATSEWVLELEGEARAMGLDPETLVERSSERYRASAARG
jgi:hypothetical protein